MMSRNLDPRRFLRTAPAMILVLSSLAFSACSAGIGSSTQPTHSVLETVPTPESFQSLALAEIQTFPFLMLVNNDYSLPDAEVKEAMANVHPYIPAMSEGILLHPTVMEATQNLFAGASATQYERFMVTSGYRTYVQQKQLYESAADKSFVMKPNHSEHQTGLAVDIGWQGMPGSQMAQSPQGQWLADNAFRYGFILRYPEDKTAITGVAFEPWHFRYVGQPHAYYCHTNGLCLEEYLSRLQSGGEYTLAIEGKTYHVYYEKPRNGIIKVPPGIFWEAAEDNTGGVIITSWENY